MKIADLTLLCYTSAMPRHPRNRSACSSSNIAEFQTLEARRLLSGALWQIHGSPKSDAILVSPDPNDATQLNPPVNGKIFSTRTASKIKSINIIAGAGNDMV